MVAGGVMLVADGRTGWGKGGEQERLLKQHVKRGAVASPSGLAAGSHQRDGDLMRAVSNFLGGGG